jgi:hypothetical protein
VVHTVIRDTKIDRGFLFGHDLLLGAAVSVRGLALSIAIRRATRLLTLVTEGRAFVLFIRSDSDLETISARTVVIAAVWIRHVFSPDQFRSITREVFTAYATQHVRKVAKAPIMVVLSDIFDTLFWGVAIGPDFVSFL